MYAHSFEKIKVNNASVDPQIEREGEKEMREHSL